MSTHPDEILISEFQAWRAEQRQRDAELRASAVRRRERERERYQRNREARLAYAAPLQLGLAPGLCKLHSAGDSVRHSLAISNQHGLACAFDRAGDCLEACSGRNSLESAHAQPHAQ